MNSHCPAASLPHQDSSDQEALLEKLRGPGLQSWDRALLFKVQQMEGQPGTTWALLRNAESGPFSGTADS